MDARSILNDFQNDIITKAKAAVSNADQEPFKKIKCDCYDFYYYLTEAMVSLQAKREAEAERENAGQDDGKYDKLIILKDEEIEQYKKIMASRGEPYSTFFVELLDLWSEASLQRQDLATYFFSEMKKVNLSYCRLASRLFYPVAQAGSLQVQHALMVCLMRQFLYLMESDKNRLVLTQCVRTSKRNNEWERYVEAWKTRDLSGFSQLLSLHDLYSFLDSLVRNQTGNYANTVLLNEESSAVIQRLRDFIDKQKKANVLHKSESTKTLAPSDLGGIMYDGAYLDSGHPQYVDKTAVHVTNQDAVTAKLAKKLVKRMQKRHKEYLDSKGISQSVEALSQDVQKRLSINSHGHVAEYAQCLSNIYRETASSEEIVSHESGKGAALEGQIEFAINVIDPRLHPGLSVPLHPPGYALVLDPARSESVHSDGEGREPSIEVVELSAELTSSGSALSHSSSQNSDKDRPIHADSQAQEDTKHGQLSLTPPPPPPSLVAPSGPALIKLPQPSLAKYLGTGLAIGLGVTTMLVVGAVLAFTFIHGGAPFMLAAFATTAKLVGGSSIGAWSVFSSVMAFPPVVGILSGLKWWTKESEKQMLPPTSNAGRVVAGQSSKAVIKELNESSATLTSSHTSSVSSASASSISTEETKATGRPLKVTASNATMFAGNDLPLLLQSVQPQQPRSACSIQ